ncbi:putative indolepyruvate oxidoreductase subunit B [Delftia tsuruhatensis]|uniref:indolepyruvate oxidoreductase subunit beta family protein n=1 Tax=Delftia tsuruhatensis TaxID=180282 RepID=UPI001E6BEF82|nr:indolepyruvate oxidoreductase subunit beta family protein [Delftia tsuruhatensis]CAB5706547.1 putative indolepyruvate oxidoreductase subunit B [Delftia tsuruhatensis]CAC9675442.1 putative indolepyruvate oxidoreductase subunit B [Delftia tsuruhatensis]
MPHSQPIKIAILAMGGEGGGVLADWIVDLAEHHGFIAQSTSVPGVAQRTGATLYYVELFDGEQARQAGGQPVLALMPLPGDVDVVLASELMEAGRAVQRGLVTPDRTTLVASTHRVYSIAEKTAMGDGRVDSAELLAHADRAARRFVGLDMARVAEQASSVVSAALFGALAATGALPWSRAQFEATIERGGVGVASSLKAFGIAHAQASRASEPVQQADAAAAPAAPAARTPADPAVAALVARVAGFPGPAQALITEGLRRLIDYQDPAYAALYLDRLAAVQALPDDGTGALLRDTARHLALWMAYEDTVRVADLKTRASRFARVQAEVRLQSGQQIAIQEFMHPRIEEICDTLPAGLGRWLARPHAVHRLVARLTRQGRTVSTSSLRGFLLLWGLARLRGLRRGSLRYQHENARIEQWLAQIAATAAFNPALAVEVALCQRLVKGYGDTHARGLANYELLMRAVQSTGPRLAPATLRALREAALADEHGHALRAALQEQALA